MNGLHGEPVAINFTSADATTAAPLILKDANGKTRVLASNERLIVDDLYANIAAATLNVDIFVTADDTSSGDIIIGSFCGIATTGLSANFVAFKHEGMSLPLGVMPKAIAGHSGAVTVVGTGRIVAVTQSAGRQSWQSTLNP